MTTTPEPRHAAAQPAPAVDEARQLVAGLAAHHAQARPQSVLMLAEQLPWMGVLPPAVRRTVLAELTRALATVDPQAQQREVADTLNRGRDLASRFAH